MVDASSQRLVNLANQWEKHRVPLIDQLRQLKEVNSNRAVSIEFDDVLDNLYHCGKTHEMKKKRF